MRVILLVGLPGSGKSYLGNCLYDENPGSIFLDDISQTGGVERIKEAVDTGVDMLITVCTRECKATVFRGRY
jgi:dephospho-CoA kinase